MKLTELLTILLVIYIPTTWVINLTRFLKCDFEPSYKAEVIHGLGLFTPVFVVTAWMDLE
jgi:hypothetical protein